MKKMIFMFLLLLLTFLIGCTKIQLMTLPKDIELTSTVEITYSELSAMFQNDETFALFISSVSCSSCIEFEPILDEFIGQYHTKFYRIEASVEIQTSNDLVPYSYTPSLAFIKDGEIILLIDPISEPSPFLNYENLNTYLFEQFDIE
ncbi:MAG: hypothetical protein KJ971_00380 [Firmicutes bacterium]|nr:hypothetical protein [Bacillota bacterium]